MAETKNPYLIRKLEESSQHYGRSFSNRYMNWKRYSSIIKSFHQELKHLKQNDQPIKILEIGCGDGWLIYRLKSEFDKAYCLEFTGIDISDLDIDFARQQKEYFKNQGCDFKAISIQNLEIGAQEFDIVIASELIEHIPVPAEAIKKIYKVLKKCGLLILTTPNKNGGLLTKTLRLLKVRGPVESKNSEEIPQIRLSSDQGVTGSGSGHVSIKSPNEWREIFKQAGFKIITSEGTGGLFFGSPQFDKHRIIFALAVILDVLAEKLPFSYSLSELVLFKLKKC